MTAGLSTFDSELSAAARVVLATPRRARVLLACHVMPDGDALGSMLGFGLGLRQLGFEHVWASFPGPPEVPEPFLFLPGRELLVPADAVPDLLGQPDLAGQPDLPGQPDLALSFDASSLDRLGTLGTPLAAAAEWIVLDHHASNTGFGTIRLIDSSAAATAVISAALLDRLGVVLNREIATCLYVGLATDTGSFRFSSTTAQVHTLAATLVRAGAEPSEIARRVFDTRPFAAIQLLADVLQRTELDRDAAHGRGLVSTYATLADLERYGLAAHVLEGFLDVVRTAAEADVTCMLKPLAAGEWAVSLRSKADTDVSAVAVGLGGGGHRLAAGFTGYGDVAHVIATVRAALNSSGAT